MRVLIIDDDRLLCESASNMLETEFFTVMTASTFIEALDLARENPPEVLVCDWKLASGADGLDLSSRFQEAFSVEVVLMSGHPLQQLAAQAARRDLRVAGYLRKPFTAHELVLILRRVRAAMLVRASQPGSTAGNVKIE